MLASLRRQADPTNQYRKSPSAAPGPGQFPATTAFRTVRLTSKLLSIRQKNTDRGQTNKDSSAGNKGDQKYPGTRRHLIFTGFSPDAHSLPPLIACSKLEPIEPDAPPRDPPPPPPPRAAERQDSDQALTAIRHPGKLKVKAPEKSTSLTISAGICDRANRADPVEGPLMIQDIVEPTTGFRAGQSNRQRYRAKSRSGLTDRRRPGHSE